MAHFAVCAFAVGNEEIRPGFGQQHVGKVFRAHGGFLRQHVLGTDDVGQHLAGEFGFLGVVDGGRVVAHKLEGAAGFVRGTHMLGHRAHAPLDHVEDVDSEGAHRALQLAAVGHHIGGFTRVDHGD